MQVVVGSDEPQDMAMKRFRREVMSAGLVQEVRHLAGMEQPLRFYKTILLNT